MTPDTGKELSNELLGVLERAAEDFLKTKGITSAMDCSQIKLTALYIASQLETVNHTLLSVSPYPPKGPDFVGRVESWVTGLCAIIFAETGIHLVPQMASGPMPGGVRGQA